MTMTKLLLKCQSLDLVKAGVRNLSCNTASVTKIHRQVYVRTYPTVVVLPNGASINIKYQEPRKIITFPLDLNTLSEAERKQRIEMRKPKKIVRVTEEVDDSFRAKKYLKYIKK